MKRTGPTNRIIRTTATQLRKQSAKTEKNIYRVISDTIRTSTRLRTEVNLFHLNEMGEKNKEKILVVPGVVLGRGELSGPITVAALRFSGTSEKKIIAKGGKAISLMDLLDEQSIPPKNMVLVK